MSTPQRSPKDKENGSGPTDSGSKIAGKIIVALVPITMIITYFAMHSGGVLLQPRLLMHMAAVLIVGVGSFMAIVALLSKTQADPRAQKLVLSFSMGLIVVMAVIVFKLNGLF